MSARKTFQTIPCPACKGQQLWIEVACCGDEACCCRSTGGYRYEPADCEACLNTGLIVLEDRPAA